jgi:hypothetical protein
VLSRLNGFSLIIAATVVAGVAGYIVTVLVHNLATQATYAVFAVYWAGLYLVIGGLSGVQQEITRSTRSVAPGARQTGGRSRTFGAAMAVLVFVVVVASAPLWVDRVFPTVGWPLVWPLAVAAASYVLVATLSGSLYGVSQWRSLALVISADGVLRLLFLVVTLAFTRDVVPLAWVAALPFPAAILLLWPFIRRGVVGRTELDVGYRILSWNVSRVIVASVSTAVLVSGFPLLLGVTAHGEGAALVAELIFTITLARAPVVVGVMSLQSYFLVRFRDEAGGWWRSFLLIQVLIAALGTVLGLLAWLLGPAVFAFVSSKEVTLDGAFMALLVISSALVGMLSVSASAVLARSQHFVYSLGWVVAALVTIAVMASPLDLVPRVVAALLLGPTAGLVVYGGWLGAQRSRPVAAGS